MEAKEVTEEFIKNELNTELDAIHPRFLEPQDAAVIREYQVQHDYYCDECRQFFAPTVEALKVHFSGDMVDHKPYASCVYCEGTVFQYKFNNERKLYHNCRDYRKKEATESDGEKTE